MNAAIAKIVHPVLETGLRLKSQLEAGAKPDLEVEQSRLKDLLLSEEEAQLHPGFGADHAAAVLPNDSFDHGTRQMTSRFLGIRYTLVCWLDEIFTTCPQWSSEWNENKLEAQLYGTNDRAWKFWEQSRHAVTRSELCALEVFYLCTNLGFRGKLKDQPDKIRSWCNQTKLRLGKVDELAFPFTTERYSFDAPPLKGSAMFRRMAVTCWAALLIVIPLISFALMRKLGQ